MKRIELDGIEYVIEIDFDWSGEDYTQIDYGPGRGLDSIELTKLYDAVGEELYDNMDKLINSLEDYGSIFITINGVVIRLGCPDEIRLTDRCNMSCKNCWISAIKERFEMKRMRSEAENLFKEGLIKEPVVVTSINSKEEKVEFLNGLKAGNELDFRFGGGFISNGKLYSICPEYVGLEGREGCYDCDRNCKECWKNNIKEYLEGEE